MTATVQTTNPSALVDAVAARDARAPATALLRWARGPRRSGVRALVEAVDAAADLTARSLVAEAWQLLNRREQRAYARRDNR
jgi:hypothetical protein